MPDRSPARRGAWLAFAAMLFAAGLLWLCQARTDAAPARNGAAMVQASADSSLEHARFPAIAPEAPAEHRTAVTNQQLADTAALAATPALHLRLRGLHPGALWTTTLHLDIDGRDEAQEKWLDHRGSATPEDDGTCTFVLPGWVATSAYQKGRIEAEDPNYLPLQHRWEDALDLTQELVLDVQVVAMLDGRVVNARGEPVQDAQVTAFAMSRGMPVDGQLGKTMTDGDGRYLLMVPPGTQLVLFATAMKPKGIGGSSVGRPAFNSGRMQTDLLPASQRATAKVGAPTLVDDLVLPDAARLSGTVKWSDGRPVESALVATMPRDGTTLAIAADDWRESWSSIQVHANGTLSPITNTWADRDGTFQLPAVPGAPVDIAVVAIRDTILVGDWPTQRTSPLQPVEILVPLPLRLRALRGGSPAPGATIEIEVSWPQSASGRLALPAVRTDERGEVQMVTTLPTLHMRATVGSLQSAWTDVATTPARTVDFELSAALGELAIEFEGDFPVRNAHFAWTRDDGPEGRQHLLRDDSSGPFRLHLEPGRYHLRVAAAGGERNGLFLLPIELDVEVKMVPQSLTLPAQFGGRFTVHATDRVGLYVRGTCRVLDASGTDGTNMFVTHNEGGSVRVGKPGELMTSGPNEFSANLPAGDYLLEFDFPEHGAQQQRVTIRPREVSDVRIRLP